MNNHRHSIRMVLLVLLFPTALAVQETAEKNLTEPEQLYEQLKQLKKLEQKQLAQKVAKTGATPKLDRPFG